MGRGQRRRGVGTEKLARNAVEKMRIGAEMMIEAMTVIHLEGVQRYILEVNICCIFALSERCFLEVCMLIEHYS